MGALSVTRPATRSIDPSGRRAPGATASKGWIDPTDYDLVLAACDDDPLVSIFAVAASLRGLGRSAWYRPDEVEPLLEQCRDGPLKRALLLALYRVNREWAMASFKAAMSAATST